MSLHELGFGMMRLPVKNGIATDFDYAKLNEMVDLYLANGFNYFDTSFVYHEGKSEIACREAIVRRYPREAFRLATKFPTFDLQTEEQIEPVFAEQLSKCGVDYFDYYLLHNFQTVYYDGIDGKGGVIQRCHLFEHANQWKRGGKIRHLGISFHSSAKLLDRILTEHPEIEFVQIGLNYYDWDSPLVQAGACYDVIVKHGKQVIAMEPVKGGALAKAPEEAEKRMKEMAPDASIASWALRFLGDLPNVMITLSGMSTIEDVMDNVKMTKSAKPLSEKEKKLLKDVVRIYKESGPYKTADYSAYQGLIYHGVPVSAILDTYNTCMIQPFPEVIMDNNYYKNAVAEEAHLNIFEPLPEERVFMADGTDLTEQLQKIEKYLIEHSF